MPRKDPEARKEYNRFYYGATRKSRKDPRELSGWARPNTANPLRWKSVSLKMLWEEYELLLAVRRRLAARSMAPEMSTNAFLLYCLRYTIEAEQLARPD